ncbi:glycosyltransferase family 39 protein [Desulfovibrio aminophilus]|uniref:glycosyltransferase family 39 protein n=1 Tax=Desulfovibrio aminophilus TaxID=81425 RepID=UPI00146F5780|nr:glycosyltransferase family 39 protein [Desulfovibrio aminophilus]
MRILTAEYVDIGGDNATRWIEVHRVLDGLGLTAWTHQTMRWTISVPVWVLMKLFGTNPMLYYVLPILTASLGTVFVYLIGEELHSRRLGIAAAVLTILFPQMAQTGSQLWPSVFIFAFLAVTIWLILVWLRRRSPALLILAGVAFVLAWGARETAIYFFPGLLLLIWLPSRSFKGVLTFCLTSGFFFGCEWLYFWLDTGSILGRLGVAKHAMDDRETLLTLPLKDYLLNILDYSKLRGLLAVLILSLIACVSELRSTDQRRRALAIMYMIFMFLMTYMVSSISRPQIVHPIGSRYWCSVAPFGLITLLLWLSSLKVGSPRAAKVCTVLLFGAFAAFTLLKIPPTNSIVQIGKDAEILTPLLAEKRPFVMRYLAWQPNAIEQAFIWIFTGINQKDRKLTQVPLFMARNLDRVAAMFLGDSRDYDNVRYAAMTPQDENVYLVTPNGAPPDATPGAEVIFDRRLCRVKPIPSSAAP